MAIVKTYVPLIKIPVHHHMLQVMIHFDLRTAVRCPFAPVAESMHDLVAFHHGLSMISCGGQ